jgi:hypothetical protein
MFLLNIQHDTRQHVFLIRRRMVATVLLLAFPRLSCQWFTIAHDFLYWREVF